MLSRDIFILGIKRLVKSYGDKNFDESRLGRIWPFVKHLQTEEWTRVVDHVLDEFRNAPLPKDFRELARTYHKPEYVLPAPIEKQISCSKCGDTGWLHIPHATIRFLAACCGCKKGDEQHSCHPEIPMMPLNSDAKRFDPDLFTPKRYNPDDIASSIQNNVSWWKSVLFTSAEYWGKETTKEEKWWEK